VRRSVLLVLSLAGALLPSRALAQRGDDASVAQALYDQALPALHAGDFATACPKLEQVVLLAPTGIGAKLTLAECYEGQGRLASAWKTYTLVEAASGLANQASRKARAHQRAAALKPRLATLTVTVPAAVLAVTGLDLQRDGVQMLPIEWGIALPVDTGPHLVTVAAPGRIGWKKSFAVAMDGDTVEVTVEEPLAEAPVADAPKPAPAPPPRVSAWTARRIAGGALGGVGLVALGVGAGFGASAIHQKNESNASGHCGAANRCDSTGIQLRDQAFQSAAASTALFLSGAVALAAGVTLVVLPLGAPAPARTARLVMGPRALELQGTW
jgi:hypothetical protein